jgi:hypothetical protein
MDRLAFATACVALACVILYLAKGQQISFVVLPTTAYASFSSTQTQNVTGETILTYNTDDVVPVNITRTSNSAIVASSGTYKVLASVQLDKTTAGSAILDLYPLVDGVALPNSATRIAITKTGEDIMTVEWYITLGANQAVSVALYSASSGFRALAVPEAVPVPAIPSIILTISRIA